MRPTGSTLVLVVVTMLAAGCGGDEADGAGASSSSSGAGSGTGGRGGGVSGSGAAGGGGATGSGGLGGAGPAEIDASTIESKLLMGYQGWFACPGDGSAPDRWVHWFRNDTPDAQNLTVDLWPDVSELQPDELFATGMTYADSSPASLYSAYTQKTVVRHFQWMKDAGLDGVFLQRFSSELVDPAFLALRNQVTENVRAGAEAYGRVFAIMYDVSGQNEATLVQDLENDWMMLVDSLQVTASPRYLQEGGKPVLAIWGLGFADRPGTAAQAAELATWFHTGADPKYQVTLVGGVPRDWRTLSGDSKTDPAWAAVYRSFDVLSPWTVGAYVDAAGADAYASGGIASDLADTKANGTKYMPVVFPGFSWHNLNAGPLNQIPRQGGNFYWRQVYNAVDQGSTLVYGAMFDEVDEGTAMFKISPNAAALPAQGSFVPLDVDGTTLPSDWYLRLAGAATKMVRGDLAPTPDIPIAP